MKVNQKILKNLKLEHEHQEKIELDTNVLGVDYGSKFTGIAFMGKGGGMIPLQVCKSDNTLVGVIKNYIKEKEIGILVMGLPLGQDGGLNPLCKEIQRFSKQFQSNTVRVEFINEKYSSVLTYKQKDERIDDLAALRILEFYIADKKLL